MTIVVAPDSFGGWKTAGDVADRVAQRLEKAGHEVLRCPMSDGGEGLLDALDRAGVLERMVDVVSVGPHGEARTGPVGWMGGCPIVESSVWLRSSGVVAPWQATSVGLGRILAGLPGQPAVIGLGGSSTVDMGLGMLVGLGGRLWDGSGRPLSPSPDEMHRLAHIELAPGLGRAWTVWSDVSTTVGDGARRFGPQKGVTDLTRLSEGWAHVVAVLTAWRASHGLDPVPLDLPGGGAAGGLGFTLACLGASMVPGAQAVADLLLPENTPQLVITGEGRLDATTADHKVVASIAEWCVQGGVRFAAVVGCVGDGRPELPGPVYVCDGSPDRGLALDLALDRLVADLWGR